jgi:3'(2'), 5'-bisphosphate nucleotidase
MDDLILTAIGAAISAGKAIMAVYDTDFTVEKKSDKSPLTLADQRSHDIIAQRLEPTDIPILSEEGKSIPAQTRRQWDTLWIVDPLDGTKEFIKKNDEFTVNIALVTQGTPVMGVIFIPAQNVLYIASQTLGAHRLSDARMLSQLSHEPESNADSITLAQVISSSQRLPLFEPTTDPYCVVGSRSHATPELEAFVDEKRAQYPSVDFLSAGSSLKFCLVAEGKAAIYPRLGPTMEWDTAAGQAIAVASGARVYVQETGQPLTYNRTELLNPYFIVERPVI